MAKPLGIADTMEVLTRLGALADQIVLIGGQALNFWAERYRSHPVLRPLEGPFASKDIDFCGTQEQVRLCAQALGGHAQYQSNEVLSTCVGVVRYVDAEQDERALDFLSAPYGLEGAPLWEMSFPVTLTTAYGRAAKLRVMHPLHCLMSRVANVADLEAYQNDHGRRQLRASIACMRAFLEERLEAGEVTTAKKLNEKVFTFCERSAYAQAVFARDGVEPFEAVVSDHARLPERFRSLRYVQMRAQIERRRRAP
jgi:hypothetical protein